MVVAVLVKLWLVTVWVVPELKVSVSARLKLPVMLLPVCVLLLLSVLVVVVVVFRTPRLVSFSIVVVVGESDVTSVKLLVTLLPVWFWMFVLFSMTVVVLERV